MKKKLLFICPKYYNYPDCIRRYLKYLEYDVDIVKYDKTGLISNLFHRCRIKKIVDYYFYNKIYKLLSSNFYNTLFVIKGDILPTEYWVKIMIQANVGRKILYQWDSMKIYNYKELLPLFDKTFSFDKNDCDNNKGVDYLPLFHCVKTISNNSLIKYDLLFIGIWHSDRIELLDKIREHAELENLSFNFKIYYPFILWLLLRLKKGRIMNSDFFIFRKIPFKKINEYYRQSRCIIDIAHPSQSGLTMRTIECIGENKKLITTNKNIEGAQFYTPDNIQVVDRNNIDYIDFSFLSKNTIYPYRDKYYIVNWLKRVLSDE